MGGSSSSPSKTTTTTTSAPPAWELPYLTDIASKAQTAYGQTSTAPYAGDLVASQNSDQVTADNQAKAVAAASTGLGNPTLAAAGVAAGNAASANNYENTSFTPTSFDTSGALAASLQPIQNEFYNKTLPGLQSASIQGGAYGGSRANITNGLAATDFANNEANTAATFNYNDMTRQDGLRATDLISQRDDASKDSLASDQALSMIPTLSQEGYNLNLQPSQTLQSVGNSEQLAQQDTLDNLYQQYQLQESAPFAGLDQYADIINGTNAGGTTKGTSSAPLSSGSSFLNTAGQVAGIGLSAAEIAALIP